MAENPDFMDAVEREAEAFISRTIREQDWEQEDKGRIQQEYMTEFGAVLREVMPMIISLYLGKEPTATEDAEEGESLEDAKILHEATLIAVTKKRKSYPAYLSKLLGKTMRLKKNTAEVMKVDLPLTEPMEGVVVADQQEALIDSLMTETNNSLSEITQKIQVDTERMTNLADFAKFVITHQDPIDTLLQELES